MLLTIDEIKNASLKGREPYWFDKSWMDFFNTVVYPKVWANWEGSYFITSEKREDEDPPMFTVRFCGLNNTVRTFGEFMAYESYNEAVARIELVLRGI